MCLVDVQLNALSSFNKNITDETAERTRTGMVWFAWHGLAYVQHRTYSRTHDMDSHLGTTCSTALDLEYVKSKSLVNLRFPQEFHLLEH